MKRCPKCGLLLPVELFAWRDKKSEKRSSYCFECQRRYCRSHYRSNKPAHNARRYERQIKTRHSQRELVATYLLEHPCVDCGEADIRVLEFDHVRGQKHAEISIMLGQSSYSWQRIEAEIAKCEVRCANCHRRKTVKQFGWFRGTFGT